MKTGLEQQYDATMRPLNRAAQQNMVLFGRWIVAELHERGVQTSGFGYVNPGWRLQRFNYLIDEMRCWLTAEKLAYLLARVYFYGKPRNRADAELCLLTARVAETYGLIQGETNG